MQELSPLRILRTAALVIAASCSSLLFAADPSVKALAPKGSFDVHYEKHLGMRVQKLVFKKKEKHPALALTKDVPALEKEGWKKCKYGAGDWINYKDATKEPLTVVHSNSQLLVRDNAVLQIVAFYRLDPARAKKLAILEESNRCRSPTLTSTT